MDTKPVGCGPRDVPRPCTPPERECCKCTRGRARVPGPTPPVSGVGAGAGAYTDTAHAWSTCVAVSRERRHAAAVLFARRGTSRSGRAAGPCVATGATTPSPAPPAQLSAPPVPHNHLAQRRVGAEQLGGGVATDSDQRTARELRCLRTRAWQLREPPPTRTSPTPAATTGRRRYRPPPRPAVAATGRRRDRPSLPPTAAATGRRRGAPAAPPR
jgi:hypothetical protein